MTSFVPSLLYAYNSIKNVPTKEDIETLTWLRENTPEDSVILTNINEGHLVTYFSQRKNVVDSNYLLISNINQRINNIKIIYTTPYKVDAVRLLNKYNVDYIYLSKDTRQMYDISDLKYATDDCFSLVYNKTTMIYKSLCKIEEEV